MQRRRQTSTSLLPRRAGTRAEHEPNVLFTALTAGVVLLLLAATFLADWLRVPEVDITSAPRFLSPNPESTLLSATLSYRLSDETAVTARVYSEGGGLVRELLSAEKIPAGQHFLTWDGSDDLGRRVSDGSYRIEISARGAIRSTAASASVALDSQPPALQLVNLPEGLRVKDPLLVVEGLTEPGAVVLLGGGFQPVTVDGQGRFRTQRKLAEGVNRVELTASDAAGNTTVAARTVQLVTAAPPVVLTSPLEDAWVNNPLVTVAGSAPAGTTVKINSKSVAVSADGFFQYDLLLDEGDQSIEVSATDDVGNVTTVQRFVHVKTRGPSLELNVADGVVFNEPQVQISGRATPGSLLTVNNRPVTVNGLGSFQAAVDLTRGENVIEVVARDAAGNATTLTRRVRYEEPARPDGVNQLIDNVRSLPALTIPAVVLLSLLIGLFFYRQNQLDMVLSVDTHELLPGLPDEGKNLALRLDLNQSARVTIEVEDAAGQVQAVLLDNRRRTARQHLFLWDGYDDFGRLVTPGVYTIRATAGSPPLRASSAVQVRIEGGESPATSRTAPVERVQPGQPLPVRRIRQNRRRI